MTDWKKFEILATDYLNQRYNSGGLYFEDVGGSDSDAPDIKVYKNDSHIFNIEAKLSPSQSGQFVVRIKNNRFVFSTKNVYSKNVYSEQIINYLNQNFKKYNNVKQAAIEIGCPESLLMNWIINHYKEKNSRFIITSTELNSFMAIVPIEQLSDCFDISADYFNVSANLRRKRSGTRHLPKSQRREVKGILERHLSNLGLSLNSFNPEGRKTTISIDRTLSREEQYFGEGRFYLSPNKDVRNEYFIKKRSFTNNINVIFSLEYIGPYKDNGFGKFEEVIENIRV